MRGFLLALVILSSLNSLDFRAAGVQIQSIPLASPICGDGFVEHELDHTTVVNGEVISTFESNGAGVAVNDLNGDGLLDIVLGNVGGPVSILWNEGAFKFRKQTLNITQTRAISIIDIDGDSLPDLVFTTQTGAPSFWRNQADGTFKLTPLPGVGYQAFSMDWADVRGDGMLSLLTGSYDAELEKKLRNDFMFGNGAGAIYYDMQDGEYKPQRLSKTSQALTVMFVDLSGDGHLDIAIGNDFTAQDQFWTLQHNQWNSFRPFRENVKNTMSFAADDLSNDGSEDFLITGMQPYPREGNAVAWMPITRQTAQRAQSGQLPQIVGNALQSKQSNGYRNIAQALGIAATGWSWSSQFGDLDSDGYLDLYVVNGMIAKDLFPQQSNHELVEQHQAFRSDHGQRFVQAPQWNLDSTRSGRGMVMADLNNDGTLDIVVNNLDSPAQLFENQICGGSDLEVDLRRTDIQNTQGISAQAILKTSTGTYRRTVRASSGYLSGVPSRLHFGLPKESQIESLDIQWADGKSDHIDSLEPNTLLTLTRH